MSIHVGYSKNYADNYDSVFPPRSSSQEELVCPCCGDKFEYDEERTYKDVCAECDKEMTAPRNI